MINYISRYMPGAKRADETVLLCVPQRVLL